MTNLQDRPTLQMNPQKGTVAAVVVNCNDDASYWRVDVWVHSPTGDASDSHIFTMPCQSASQAEAIAVNWRKVWGL